MNLLTLTVTALCLVSGALAGSSTLEKTEDNGDIKLTCTGSSAVPLDYSFTRDGTAVATVQNKITVTPTAGTLVIVKAEAGNYAGTYKCKGSDTTESNGEAVAKSTIKAETLNDKVTITCTKSLLNKDATVFLFKKDDNDLKDENTDKTLNVDKGSGDGKYKCMAKKNSGPADDAWSEEITVGSSSAPRLLTTTGLIFSLCLLLTNLL